ERDVDLLLAERDVDVAVDVDRDGVVAAFAEGGEHRLSGAEGHLALARQAPEQHSDLAGLHIASFLSTRTPGSPPSFRRYGRCASGANFGRLDGVCRAGYSGPPMAKSEEGSVTPADGKKGK